MTKSCIADIPPKEWVAEDLKDPAVVVAGIRRAAVGAQEKKYCVCQK